MLLYTADMTKKTVAIAGASGPLGAETLRLALGHPHLEVVQVTSEYSAGLPVTTVLPHLRGATSLTYESFSALRPADIVLLALPPRWAASHLGELEQKAHTIVDTGPDFRLRDPDLYQAAHGFAHPAPEALGGWVTALPELRREALRGARRISGLSAAAVSVILPLYPLLQLGALAPRDIEAVTEMALGADSQAVSAAEIVQELPGRFPITLHLKNSPRARGVLTRISAWVPDGWSERDAHSAYRQVYGDQPFVRVARAEGAPAYPSSLSGTQFCDIAVGASQSTGGLRLYAMLDGWIRGGAGQAIHALNVAQGWDEQAGLGFLGLYP